MEKIDFSEENQQARTVQKKEIRAERKLRGKKVHTSFLNIP